MDLYPFFLNFSIKLYIKFKMVVNIMNLYEELKIIKEDSNEIFGKLFIDENTNEFKISSTNGITIQDLNVENLNISS
jgi:hypothetical protein